MSRSVSQISEMDFVINFFKKLTKRMSTSVSGFPETDFDICFKITKKEYKMMLTSATYFLKALWKKQRENETCANVWGCSRDKKKQKIKALLTIVNTIYCSFILMTNKNY